MGWSEVEYAKLPRISTIAGNIRDREPSSRFHASYDLQTSYNHLHRELEHLKQQCEQSLREMEEGVTAHIYSHNLPQAAIEIEKLIVQFKTAQDMVASLQQEDEDAGGFKHEDPHAVRIGQTQEKFTDSRGANRARMLKQPECLCGWKGGWHRDEKDALKEHKAHVKEVS